MANNANDNRRVKYGAIFLLVLLGANFLVRIGKKPATTANPANRPPITTQPPAIRPEPAKPLPSPDKSPLAQPTPQVPSEFGNSDIELQLNRLSTELSQFKASLNSLPELLPEPKLNVALFLSRQNLFEFSKPVIIIPVETQATDTASIPVASMPPPLELVGIFARGSRKKLMVKRENRVYLVNENEMNPNAEFSLISSIDGQYTILDRFGQEHLLSMPEPEETNVDKVIKILKNPDQPIFYSIMDNKPEAEPGAKKP